MSSGDSIPTTLRRWSLPIFLALLVAYLLIFFTAPAPDRLRPPPGSDEQLTRLDMTLWVTTVRVRELPQAWTGGNWRNVAVVDRIGVFITALAILALALLLGFHTLRLIRVVPLLTRLEKFTFSLGVGLNALSLFCLLIGLFGLLNWLEELCLIVLILLILASSGLVKASVGKPIIDFAEQNRMIRRKMLEIITYCLRPTAIWAAAPFLLLIFAGAILPPREFDVREYHLQAPKEWFQQGRITFMPHNIYANMPLGPQILSLPAMAVMPGERAWWWGALAGKVVIASYSVLTMLALLAAGRRFFDTTAGVAAALIYISIPWTAFVSIEGYVDGALACNLFLAAYAAMIWHHTRQPQAKPHQPEGQAKESAAPNESLPRSRFGLVLLAGFLAGAAVSCKYTAVVFVAIPLAAWIALVGQRIPSRESRQEGPQGALLYERACRLRWLGVFVLAAAAGCGPWLGKNGALAGNPVYPLAYSVFGGNTRTAEKDRQWRAAHAVPVDEHGRRYSPRQIAAAAGNIAIYNDWPSPIVLPLAALAFFISAHRRPVLMLAGWFAFILAAWFLFTHRIDRFWIPALPFAALLAGAGAAWRSDAWWRRIAVAMLFWGLAWNLLVIAGMLAPPKLLVDLASLQSDGDRVRAAHLWLNEHVPAGKQVLMVGDAEPFDLQIPALYNTCFDDSIFEHLMKDRSASERLAALHEPNISHVYVHWGEVKRYRQTYGFTDFVTPGVFRELVDQGVLKQAWVMKDPKSGDTVAEIYAVARLIRGAAEVPAF